MSDSKTLIFVDVGEQNEIVIRCAAVQWFGRLSKSTTRIVLGQHVELNAASSPDLGVQLSVRGRVAAFADGRRDRVVACASGLTFAVEVAWADRGVLAAMNSRPRGPRKCREGLIGDLREMPLMAIAQLLGNRAMNARVVLRPHTGLVGGVYFEHALVVWAKQGDTIGDEALRALLRVETGTFVVKLADAQAAPARNVGAVAAKSFFEEVRRRNETRSAFLAPPPVVASAPPTTSQSRSCALWETELIDTLADVDQALAAADGGSVGRYAGSAQGGHSGRVDTLGAGGDGRERRAHAPE